MPRADCPVVYTRPSFSNRVISGPSGTRPRTPKRWLYTLRRIAHIAWLGHDAHLVTDIFRTRPMQESRASAKLVPKADTDEGHPCWLRKETDLDQPQPKRRAPPAFALVTPERQSVLRGEKTAGASSFGPQQPKTVVSFGAHSESASPARRPSRGRYSTHVAEG